MMMLQKLLDWWSPPCPSGLSHRIKLGLVTNDYGNTYCYHRDCIKANFDDVRKYAPKFVVSASSVSPSLSSLDEYEERLPK